MVQGKREDEGGKQVCTFTSSHIVSLLALLPLFSFPSSDFASPSHSIRRRGKKAKGRYFTAARDGRERFRTAPINSATVVCLPLSYSCNRAKPNKQKKYKWHSFSPLAH